MGTNQVLNVGITNIRIDSFDNLSQMGWCHLDTSQLKCIHFMWDFAELWNNCRIIHHVVSVSSLLHCATVVHMQ